MRDRKEKLLKEEQKRKRRTITKEIKRNIERRDLKKKEAKEKEREIRGTL
jgi:hypothetical protein